jgi:perosamine synthetase
MYVPVNEILLDGNEKKYLNECIDTGWVSSEGPFVQKFENDLANYFGRKHAIAVTNGTVAIDIAVDALELKEGDEVILPTFTIISCITGILRKRCKPVFVDHYEDTWNMDVSQIEDKITTRTKAIMVVHNYGLPVDMNPILRIADKYELKVIEDAAEMHGQEYYGKKCGSFGDISTVSFYPNKLITTGEGGMVFTDDDRLAERCRSLRNLCFIPEQRFLHYELGYNARMSNIQAALGVAQLERIDEFILKKRLIGELYQSKLKDLTTIQLPVPETAYARNIYWIFGIVLKDSSLSDAKTVMKELADKGVGTRPFFWSLHEQPVLMKLGIRINESFPISERLSRRGFYIPSGLAINEHQIDFVVEKVKEVLNQV